MPVRLLLIAVVAVLVASGSARAADDEYREKRAIFILGDLQQWAGLKYLFSEQKSTGSSGSSSHEFQETYNGTFGLDVLSPHLFSTSMNFSLGFDQDLYSNENQGSSLGNSVRYNYQFTGTGLDRSPTPFTISSYKTTQTIISPYSPAYTSDTNGVDLDIVLRNKLLPSELRYSHITQDNSGGGMNNNSASDSFSYTVTHRYKDFSTTGLALTLTQTGGDSLGGNHQASRAYSITLNNSLFWGADSKYNLTSMFQVFDTVDQNIPQRNVNLSEAFHDRLGKALDLVATYTLSTNTILNGTDGGFTTNQTDTRINTGEFILTHRLFESVVTKFRAKGSYNELLDGTEYHYAGGGEMTYTKKVPGSNRLVVMVSGLHEVTDNQLGRNTQPIIDEVHSGAFQGQIINLNTVPIKRVTEVRNSSRTLLFTEGADYVVNPEIGTVTVMVGGHIATNGPEELLISYEVAVDPVLKYSTDTINVSSTLTFKAGKYMVGGAYMTQGMDLIAGPAENNLRSSTMKMLFFNANADPLNYRVSYTETSMGATSTRALEGSGQLVQDTRFARFSLMGTERYTEYGATANLPAFSENAMSASIAGVRNLSHGRFTLTANVFDSRSEVRAARDIVSLRASLLFVLNKMSVTIDGQTSWSFSGGNTARDNTLSVDLLRYF